MTTAAPTAAPETLDKDPQNWAMFCHLAALVGLFGNGVGYIIGPLLVWLIKKDEYPLVAEHGKASLNFQITMILTLLASGAITVAGIVAESFIFGIGIVLLLSVAIVMNVLPIVAAMKLSKGESYDYPIAIRFLR